MKQLPITQLSVFLDNRPGSLSEVMTHLDKSETEIFALSIADAGEFGLVRMIVDEPQKMSKILEDANFSLAKSRKNTEVTAVLIGEKDKISDITKILGDKNINIDYAYSSAVYADGKSVLVLRLNDVDRAERILKENGIIVLSLSEIKRHLQ